MMNYPVAHEIRPLTKRQMTQLLTDLTQARVATLKKGRTNLSYIEAWDARRTAIRIFGFGGFSTRVLDVETVYQEQDVPAFEYNEDRKAGKRQKATAYEQPYLDEHGNMQIRRVLEPDFNWRVAVRTTVEVYIHQLGAIYTDAGVAGQVGPDIGEVADFATKTATSDTFKRCMINLGTQFGLSLYDNGSLGDVVQQVIAPGQRPIDVDWAAFRQANEDIQRKADLKAAAEAANAPAADPAPAASEAPVDGPSQQEQAAAADTLAGGFGPQS